MLPVSIPNRPFATEPITGAMLPDGFFEASLGKQRLNAHFRHAGAAPLTNANIYVEGASHPGIVITPRTYFIANLGGGGAQLLTWDIDVSGVPQGTYYLSFVATSGTTLSRIIKKIFVTRVQFDPATNTFSIQAPEGILEVIIKGGLGPKNPPCCGKDTTPPVDDLNFVNDLGLLVAQLPSTDLEYCPPIYLFTDLELAFRHNPPFTGQYSDLPFQDPWWKTLLTVLLVIFLIAAVVAAFVIFGSIGVALGSIATFATCCAAADVASPVLFGSVLGAAASAVLAGLTDVRDPFRRGQDNTLPAANERTVAEQLNLTLAYPEPVAVGRPFSVQAKWDYTRLTDAGTAYTFSVNEMNQNTHVLSKYEIEAPNVVRAYKGEPFIVKGTFLGPAGETFKADQLFVRCILQGTGPQAGRFIQFMMQDDGIDPDQDPADGVYTGQHIFDREKDRGLWMIFVIAQDVNTATPDLSPEDAAKIIGGQVLTHQLTIDFKGGTCPFVPDGDVNVI